MLRRDPENFDWTQGGGTNDTTIMDFGEGVFEVLATSGDTKTGGADLDQAVMDYTISEFKHETGIDLKGDAKALARLKEAAETAKIELSNLITTDIDLPYITSDTTGPKNLHITLTRAKLEQLTRPIVEKITEPILKTLSETKLTQVQIDKIILMGGQTKMPLVQQFIEDIIGKKPERGIDPMECVAIGAAIQGGVLTGEISDIVLLDVTPLSLGIETLGGVFTKIIERNTTIPVKQSQTFSTAADSQTAVTVHVLQGERSMAKDNISLGQFNLTNIPPAPRGVPQIDVTFDINADGVLNVSAKDLGTGNKVGIKITASTKLNKTEKDRMIKEAEQFAEQDKRIKKEAEIRNTADSLIYTTEKTLKDLSDKIAPEQKTTIQEAIQGLKDSLKSGGLAEISAKVEELKRLAEEMGASAYQQATSEKTQQQANQETPPNTDEQQKKKTVDAEYKVVDE